MKHLISLLITSSVLANSTINFEELRNVDLQENEDLTISITSEDIKNLTGDLFVNNTETIAMVNKTESVKIAEKCISEEGTKKRYSVRIEISDKKWLKKQKRSCRKKRKKNPNECIPNSVNELTKFIKKSNSSFSFTDEILPSETFVTKKTSCAKKAIERFKTRKFNSFEECIFNEKSSLRKCAEHIQSSQLKREENKWVVSFDVEYNKVKSVSSEAIFEDQQVQKTEHISALMIYTPHKSVVFENKRDHNRLEARGYAEEFFFENIEDVKAKLITTGGLYEFDYNTIAKRIGIRKVEKQQCRQQYVTDKIINVDKTPTFFFRATGAAELIGYSTFINNGFNTLTNYLLDSETGITYYTPGKYDPVMMQNKRLLSVPMVKNLNFDDPDYGAKGLAFYKYEDIKKYEHDTFPMYFDSTMRGYYQSIGVLNETESKTTYRVIIETGSLHYRDYVEERRNGVTTKFYPISDKKVLCSNLDLKLPMVSKDGTMVTGFNPKTSKSNIVRINGENCDIIRELPFLTGKASFSYDNKKIAYHKYRNPKNEYYNNYLDLPPNTQIANIYEMDIATGEETRVTTNMSKNSIFPDYLSNGDLIIVNHPLEKSDSKYFEILTRKEVCD